MSVPSAVVPLGIRAARKNRTFIDADAAREHIRSSTLRPAAFGPPRRLRSDVEVQVRREVAGPVYTLTPRSPGPVTGGVVYVHGGAWVNEIAPQHWRFVAELAAEARVSVTVPIYPLLPFGSAGPTLDWIVELVGHSEEAVGATCLAGDSAGGQIALSTAMRLRDLGRQLPLTTLISPALDLTLSNPQIAEVATRDPWLATPGIEVFAQAWAAGLSLTDPAVSPLHGDLHGLGAIQVFTGTRDLLNPDTHLLVGKARTAGVDIDLHEGHGQVHVYPLVPTAIGRAAAATAIARIATALRTTATTTPG